MAWHDITLSVVSHRQNALVNALIGDLRRADASGRIALLMLTENVPDPVPFALDGLPFNVEVLANSHVKGFGANHNTAFIRCATPYFCIANPDVRLVADPFPVLAARVRDGGAGVAGPLVRNAEGAVEDSARRFPTTASLLKKAFSGPQGPDYPADHGALEVDWVAGMFMLFDAAAYRQVGGFDEAFFLYYEDVDICRRLKRIGKPALYDPAAEVVHAARRASRRDFAHARHHLASLLRFLARS